MYLFVQKLSLCTIIVIFIPWAKAVDNKEGKFNYYDNVESVNSS